VRRPTSRRGSICALDSLPSLTSLELDVYDEEDQASDEVYEPEQADELIPTLHRLCSSQLDHLSLPRRYLYFLITQQPRAVMPRLRSLTVTQSAFLGLEVTHPISTLDVSFVDLFPSLLHLSASCLRFVRWLAAVRLPPLSSFTVQGSPLANLRNVRTRAFRVHCPDDYGGRLHYR